MPAKIRRVMMKHSPLTPPRLTACWKTQICGHPVASFNAVPKSVMAKRNVTSAMRPMPALKMYDRMIARGTARPASFTSSAK